MKPHAMLVITLLVVALVAGPTPAAAEEKELGWSDQAEFSLVATSGNSETSTLGFKNELVHRWEPATLIIKAGAIRAKSDTITRFAVGTVDDYSEEESSVSELTSESYYLNGRYGREISEKFFWYTGASWERNEFAGFDNRYLVEGGVGNIWRNDDDLKFHTQYALTYTRQEDVVELPDADDTWAGLRISSNYMNKFGANTTYENELILDANLEEGSRWRGDMTNSVAVSMNSRLALKVSVQLLYENEPAVTDGNLFDPGDLGTPIGTVPVELDDLDTIFTASLVVNF